MDDLTCYEQEAVRQKQRALVIMLKNRRENFLPGRPFRRPFQHAKTLASGTNTDQGLVGDLLQNHTYRGFIMQKISHFSNRLPLHSPPSRTWVVREQRATAGSDYLLSHRNQTLGEGRP